MAEAAPEISLLGGSAAEAVAEISLRALKNPRPNPKTFLPPSSIVPTSRMPDSPPTVRGPLLSNLPETLFLSPT